MSLHGTLTATLAPFLSRIGVMSSTGAPPAAIIEQAAPWFRSCGIDPGTVYFVTFSNSIVAREAGSMVLVGIGRTIDGDDQGFALEIAPSGEIADATLLVPGAASAHRAAIAEAIATGRSLLDTLRARHEIAVGHRRAALN